MIKYEFWPKGKGKGDAPSVNELLGFLTENFKKLKTSDLDRIGRNSRLLLARDLKTGRIVGMSALALVDTPSGRSGRIEDVVVHGDCRGRGIGKHLLTALIRESKRLRLAKVGLTSRPQRTIANKLYKDLGFEKVKTNVYKLKLSK